MKNLNILIVEGNLKEENQNFLKVGIQTHTESLKDSLNVFNNNYHFDVINPSSDQNLDEVKNRLPKYDFYKYIIWKVIQIHWRSFLRNNTLIKHNNIIG